MEPDRYQQNHIGYIISLVSLLISMTLFGIAAYIFPHIAFGWFYNVSIYIITWINLIHVAYNITEYAAGWYVMLIFILLAFIFAGITYITSDRIESEIYQIEREPVEERKNARETRETVLLVLKTLVIIAIVYGIVTMLHWAISTNQQAI